MRMMAITLPLLAVVGYGKVVPVPEVPYITPIQQAAINKAATLGKEAAAAARPQLLELMQRPAFRSYLKEMADRPELANMQPEDILTNIGLQYQAAEVVHNWSPVGNHVVDLNLDSALPYKTFFQEWQLSALGLSKKDSADRSSIENWNEVNIYNFPNFTTTEPDYVEASNRIIYGALNLRKWSMGNPFLGNISCVFRNSRIRNASTIFGTDTGLYSTGCSPDYVTHNMPGFSLNCSAFQPVGNFDYWEHTILANVLLYNDTTAFTHTSTIPQSEYPEFNMAYLTATFLNEDYSKMPPIINRLADFIEANPALNAKWDTDIKMVLLKFRSNMFGTGTADLLRQWAISKNFVLVWGNDNTTTITSNDTYYANQRILDPYVLSQISAGRNSTSDPSFPNLVSTFESFWTAANLTLPRLNNSQEIVDFYWSSWNSVWDSFKGSVLEVQPLTGTSCSDNDCAVVRVVDKKCICG
eukprot:TRINITY_DN959_c0_g1_i2.p1 TRINITY_DN959_c0_g1~~TRINITY_DN959_c0_g1_i2.p1  ORF type:complete len:491 (+),score=77.76 TRINITY_DN959_c0_g1_i2:66-1475(+)